MVGHNVILSGLFLEECWYASKEQLLPLVRGLYVDITLDGFVPTMGAPQICLIFVLVSLPCGYEKIDLSKTRLHWPAVQLMDWSIDWLINWSMWLINWLIWLGNGSIELDSASYFLKGDFHFNSGHLENSSTFLNLHWHFLQKLRELINKVCVFKDLFVSQFHCHCASKISSP